jgi:hypothetical protein
MFGFVKTVEKQKITDNNDLLLEKKRREKRFMILFAIIALSILNISLYFLTKIN